MHNEYLFGHSEMGSMVFCLRNLHSATMCSLWPYEPTSLETIADQNTDADPTNTTQVVNSHPLDNCGPGGGLRRLYIASYDDLIDPMVLRIGGSDGIGGIGSRRSGGDPKSRLRELPSSSPRDPPTG